MQPTSFLIVWKESVGEAYQQDKPRKATCAQPTSLLMVRKKSISEAYQQDKPRNARWAR